MLTTNDIKIKEAKPEKLTIISTDKISPKEFKLKGKPALRNKTIITTGNVEEFQKKGKGK